MSIIQNTVTTLSELKIHLYDSFLWIIPLWGIHIINMLTRFRLAVFGILPRHIIGLPGIILSPFIHGNFEHLLFNSISLWVLLALLMTQTAQYVDALLMITVLSGLGVWLIGRPGLHIGASGVAMGIWGYVLYQAYLNPSQSVVIIALVCLYVLGGMVVNLFAAEEGVSFEGHVIGCLSGLFTAYIMQ